jgi:hypothetical protein
MVSRRWPCQEQKIGDSKKRTGLVHGEISSILASLLVFLPSLDHFVRPVQHRLGDGHADLLGRFLIDHQLEFRQLLHR